MPMAPQPQAVAPLAVVCFCASRLHRTKKALPAPEEPGIQFVRPKAKAKPNVRYAQSRQIRFRREDKIKPLTQKTTNPKGNKTERK